LAVLRTPRGERKLEKEAEGREGYNGCVSAHIVTEVHEHRGDILERKRNTNKRRPGQNLQDSCADGQPVVISVGDMSLSPVPTSCMTRGQQTISQYLVL
jgi:hypothetical protein